MIILRDKIFTKWDDTDNLKRAKDSDILAAEEKKPVTGYGEIATRAGAGALAGGTIGALALGAKHGFSKVPGKTFAGGVKKGLVGGAIAGGLLLAHGAIKKRNQEAEDAEFYNDRLKYAKRQALRREKADWHANMTQRDGYSY